MKKEMVVLLSAVLLAGCTEQKQPESSVIDVTPEPVVVQSAWVHAPEFDFDKVSEVKVSDYQPLKISTKAFGEIVIYVECEKEGYPQEWNDSAYATDALLVEKANKQGIYAHDGTEIYPLEINMVNTAYRKGVTGGFLKNEDGSITSVIGFNNSSKGNSQVFSEDFRTLSDHGYDDFIYEVNSKKNKDPYLAICNNKLGVVGMTYTESGAMSGWEFEPFTPAGMNGNVIVPVVDDTFSVKSYAIIGPDGSYIAPLNSEMKYINGSYVNGHYVISDGTYYTMIDAKTGVGIAVQYAGAGYYEDGYAPMKKAGKWGYVDIHGKEVTDFIFDEAGAISHGMAWVKYNGLYGILDFTEVMDDDEMQINAYWCDPSDEPVLGKATVQVNGLNIRVGSDHSRSAGDACKGSVYPVFEVKKDDNYTWYRINKTMWVASEGTWVTYEETK